MTQKIVVFILMLSSVISADIKGTNGQIIFDTQSDNQAEMTLNRTGLGIGTTPSSNLHVNGNMLVSGITTIGSTTATSNLHINGTQGYSIEEFNASDNLGDHSVVFANSSNGNLILFLPDASTVPGQTYMVKKTSSLNKVFLRDGGFIDNYSDICLDAGSTGSISLFSASGNWHILEISGNGTLVPADNLVGWWKLDETSGIIAQDSSASGLDATLEGGLDFSSNSISGKLKNALSFDNVDDKLMVANNSILQPPHVSVSVWVLLTSLASHEGILGQTSSLYPSGGYFLRRDVTSEGGRFSMFIYDGASPEPRANATSAVTTNQWYHVVSTFNETQLKIYVNGQLEKTTARVASINYGTGGSFRIGSYGNGGVPFPGIIDDVRVYNRALTAEEVQTLYDQGQ